MKKLPDIGVFFIIGLLLFGAGFIFQDFVGGVMTGLGLCVIIISFLAELIFK